MPINFVKLKNNLSFLILNLINLHLINQILFITKFNFTLKINILTPIKILPLIILLQLVTFFDSFFVLLDNFFDNY